MFGFFLNPGLFIFRRLFAATGRSGLFFSYTEHGFANTGKRNDVEWEFEKNVQKTQKKQNGKPKRVVVNV